MNPIASAILIVLGILILLASVGVISTGFWDVILWLFAVGFGTVGLLSLIRDFPRGLVSLTIGVTLFLKLLGIIEMGFWTSLGSSPDLGSFSLDSTDSRGGEDTGGDQSSSSSL